MRKWMLGVLLISLSASAQTSTLTMGQNTMLFITMQNSKKNEVKHDCYTPVTKRWVSPQGDNELICRGSMNDQDSDKATRVKHGTKVKYFPLPDSQGDGVGVFRCDNGNLIAVSTPCEPKPQN